MIFDAKDLQGSYIDKNVDARILHSTMQFVEDTYIIPSLPTHTYKELETKPLPQVMQPLLKDLLPAFAWFVNAEIILPLSQKTKNSGLITNSGDGYNSNSIGDQFKLRDYYIKRAEVYLDAFKKKYFSWKEPNFDNCPFCLDIDTQPASLHYDYTTTPPPVDDGKIHPTKDLIITDGDELRLESNSKKFIINAETIYYAI